MERMYESGTLCKSVESICEVYRFQELYGKHLVDDVFTGGTGAMGRWAAKGVNHDYVKGKMHGTVFVRRTIDTLYTICSLGTGQKDFRGCVSFLVQGWA